MWGEKINKSPPFFFLQQCLRLDPDKRPTSSELLKHGLFSRDGFSSRYSIELKHKLQKEHMNNPLYKTYSNSSGVDGTDVDNRDAEGTSRMGAGIGAGAAGKKKKKTDSKEPSGTSYSKELRKDPMSVAKDFSRKVGSVCLFLSENSCLCLKNSLLLFLVGLY